MPLLNPTAKQSGASDKKTDVLPGIVATVIDDKKNEIYLDLELEPVEEPAAKAPQDISPGLAASIAKKRSRGIPDPRPYLRTYLRHYRQQAVILSCALVIAAAAAFAVYLIYAPPVTAPAPDATPLTPEPPQSRPAETMNTAIQPTDSALVAPASPKPDTQAAPHKAVVPRLDETPLEQPHAQPALSQTTARPVVPEPPPRVSATDAQVPPPKPKPTAQLPPEPSDPPQEAADYYLYAAHACEAGGDLTNALTWYKKALVFDPKGFRLLNKIAFILMRMELYDEASAYAERAIMANGDYIPALVNLGIIRARQEKPDEAQRLFDRALNIDNTNTDALYNMMLLCRKQGDYKRAEELERKLAALGRAPTP